MHSLFGYIGPETIMPVVSAIIAVFGAAMFMWRGVLGFFRKIFGRLLPNRDDTTTGGS
jgi:hypothetical protein